MTEITSSSPQTKNRMSQRLSKVSEAMSKKECVQKKPAVLELPKLKSQYGIEAWKRWVQWRQTQPNLEKPRYACKSGLAVNTVTKVIVGIMELYLLTRQLQQ